MPDERSVLPSSASVVGPCTAPTVNGSATTLTSSAQAPVVPSASVEVIVTA